jgi:hypothetical protein
MTFVETIVAAFVEKCPTSIKAATKTSTKAMKEVAIGLPEASCTWLESHDTSARRIECRRIELKDSPAFGRM